MFVSTPVCARFQSSTASLNSHQPALVYAKFQVSAASVPDQEPVYLLFVVYEMSWYMTFTCRSREFPDFAAQCLEHVFIINFAKGRVLFCAVLQPSCVILKLGRKSWITSAALWPAEFGVPSIKGAWYTVPLCLCTCTQFSVVITQHFAVVLWRNCISHRGCLDVLMTRQQYQKLPLMFMYSWFFTRHERTWRSRGVLPLMHNFGTRWRSVVWLHVPSLYSRERNPVPIE